MFNGIFDNEDVRTKCEWEEKVYTYFTCVKNIIHD